MPEIKTRCYSTKGESAVNEVIRKAFQNPGATAKPMPPSRYIIVAEIGNKIVGHASIRPFLLLVRGKKIRTGILHMVGTDPDHQRLGVGHAMMDKCIEVMNEENLMLSILMTPVPKFYSEKGWEIIQDSLEIKQILKSDFYKHFSPEKSKIKIQDGNPDNIDTYIKIRNLGSKNYSLVDATNRQYFEKIYQAFCNESITNFFHEISLNDDVIGYMLGNRTVEVKQGEPIAHNIKEWYMKSWTEDVINPVIHFLFQFDEDFEAINIACPIPEHTEKLIRHHARTIKKEKQLVDMVRVNKTIEFLLEIKEQMLENVKNARIPGSTLEKVNTICIKTKQCSYQIKLVKDKIDVKVENQIERENNTFEIKNHGIAQMLVGKCTPSSLIKDKRAECKNPEIVELLDKIFKNERIFISYNSDLFQSFLHEMNIKDSRDFAHNPANQRQNAGYYRDLQ
ncbi:MAG: GNAT family N-acetyltransferase [Promethearchaeota archaeon]